MESVQALLLVLVTAASLCPAIAVEVQVLPDLASNCLTSSDNSGETLSAVNIDTALMNTCNRSNTTLLLENGCYHINSFRLLQNLSNISLIGSGSETTIVKCQGDVGLAFVNISGLLISDVTITNCNYLGNNLLAVIEQSLGTVYSFPYYTNIAIFIGVTSDFQAHNMIVRNTTGMGMMAINLMGKSDMSNMTFMNNINSCGIGGGLYILYADYLNPVETVIPQLTISSALFKMNYNSFRNFGGGLTITLTQIKFLVHIKVISSVFENNKSPLGAGTAIIYRQSVSGSSVNLNSSMLKDNKNVAFCGIGGPGGGGGLAIILNFDFFPPGADPFFQNILPSSIFYSTIFVENSVIEENQANFFAGASILSYNSPLTTNKNQNRVIFKSCSFLKNRSPTGAAFGAQSTVFSGLEPEVYIIFDNVTVKENDALSFDLQESLQAGSTEERSVVVLSSVNLTISGKSQFTNNLGTALQLTRSVVTINGDTSIAANEGSGIILSDSSRINMQRSSNLSFSRNKATSKGGAIFADLSSFSRDFTLIDDCFLYFEEINSATIVFEDNQAPVGGTIYGSRLSNCPWAVYPDRTKPSSGVAFLQQLPSVTFNPSVLDSSVVSTDAFYLVRNISQPIYAIPGKEMALNITAFDLFNQTVSTTISSGLFNDTTSRSRLGNSGNWLLIPNNTVLITFYGMPGNEFSVIITAINSYAHLNLSVTFVNCTYGFDLRNENLSCECDLNLPYTCNQQNFEIQVPSHEWLGNSPTGGYAYASCILDYCKVDTTIISDGDIDSQCEPEYNRVGLLCASCKPNMSVVFGSNACRPCSSAYLASIIMYSVLAIVLVMAISFLGFSISEGYLNSLLFYCNVTS